MQVKLDALGAHLDQRLGALYVVHGDEHLLAIEAADRIRATARKAGYVERDVLHVDRYFKWNRLVESGQSMSLFGDRKLVDLRIPGGKPGKDGSAALVAYASAVANADAIVTLITLPRLDGDQRRSAWFSALDEVGVTIEAPLVDRARLPQWIAARLAAQQQHADPQALAFIAERVEGNLLAAHQEIQKLALLHPTGRLSFDDVRDAVLDVARFDVFKLGEAMLAGDAKRVARMIEGLKGEGETPVLVLWAVTEEVRSLLRAKMGVASGQPLASLLRQLRVWGPRERLFEGAMQRLSMSTLREALARCGEIDRIVKGLRNLGAQAMGDPWTELARIGMAIAGASSVKPVRAAA